MIEKIEELEGKVGKLKNLTALSHFFVSQPEIADKNFSYLSSLTEILLNLSTEIYRDYSTISDEFFMSQFRCSSEFREVFETKGARPL